jgi:hypothetical protein
MAALLNMPATADEAMARLEAPMPDDWQLREEALANFLSGGSLGRAMSRRIFRDIETQEPELSQMEKDTAWRNLQREMCKLSLLDHMDDRLALVQMLMETPDPDMEAHYRELFRQQIADARTEFLLFVMASITTGR